MRIDRPSEAEFINRQRFEVYIVLPEKTLVALDFHSLIGGSHENMSRDLARLEMPPAVARLLAYLLVQGADLVDGKIINLTEDYYEISDKAS